MQNNKNEKTESKPSKDKQSYSLRLIAIGIAILLITSPWILYLYNYNRDDKPEKTLELEHYTHEAIDKVRNYIIVNLTETIQKKSMYNINLTELKNQINENANVFISSEYQPFLIPDKDIEININLFTIDIEPMFRASLDLSRAPRRSQVDEYNLDFTSVGIYQDTSVPFSYRVRFDLQINGRQQIKDNGDDTWDTLNRMVSIKETLPVPQLFIEYKLQQFLNQGETAYSDLARMVKYMLTTLARIRVNSKDNFGGEESYKNIISKGDVELILNLAIILEEALIFRVYDEAAVEEIDNFFFSAHNQANRKNPTGKRQWGTAEQSNYKNYLNRRPYLNNPEDRLLNTLMSKYVNAGYIDPADLMALYLVLDKNTTRPAKIDSPKDTVAILEEEYETRHLMDPRTANDASDTTNLKFILTLPEEYNEGFKVTSAVDGAGQKQSIQLEVDQVPKYLVLGADFKLQGIDDPRSWHTTSSLRDAAQTRTPSVVKIPPEDHDYRTEWNLNIEGSFKINLKTGQNSHLIGLKNKQQSKIIKLDLPINIYVWFNKKPKIGSLGFPNFNTGAASPSTGEWEITSESHLVEYFEKVFWEYLKPFASLGFDEVYSILPIIIAELGLEYFDEENKEYLNELVINNNPINNNWLADILLFQTMSLKNLLNSDLTNFWIKFDIFMRDYYIDYLDQYDEEYGLYSLTTEPQFPHPPLFPWISVLGYEVNLLYDLDSNIMNITFLHEHGYFSLLLTGYNTSSNLLDITIACHLELPEVIKLDTHISTIDLNLVKPNFYASGELFDAYRFTTQPFPKQDNQILVTRLKFGKLYPAAELKLPALSISPKLHDISVDLAFYIPKDDFELKNGLVEKIKSIDTDLKVISDQDKVLQNQMFIAKTFKSLSEKLKKWLEQTENFKGLAIEFAIRSNNRNLQLDFSNLTVFLSELKSTKDFIDWLGKYSLELLLAMSHPDHLFTNLAYILTQDDQLLTLEELNSIDFEAHNEILDNTYQKQLDIQDIILDEYKLSMLETQNLTLIISFSGKALSLVRSGLLKENANTDNTIKTLSQVYYSYQQPSLDDEPINTQILLGTDYFIHD